MRGWTGGGEEGSGGFVREGGGSVGDGVASCCGAAVRRRRKLRCGCVFEERGLTTVEVGNFEGGDGAG